MPVCADDGRVLSQRPSFLPPQAFIDEADADPAAKRRREREKTKTPQESALDSISELASVAEVVEKLAAEPAEARYKGAHWALPLQLRASLRNS